MKSITAHTLATWLTEGKALLLLDVRRAQAFQNSGVRIATAEWQDPALWLDWKDHVLSELPVVLYCAHGQEISQGLTAALSAMGRDACFLQGGMAAWQTAGQAVQPVTTGAEQLRD